MKKKPTKGVAEPEPGAQLVSQATESTEVKERKVFKCWKSASAGKISLCR